MNPINYSTEHTQVPLNYLPGGGRDCDLLNDIPDFMTENILRCINSGYSSYPIYKAIIFLYHQAENFLSKSFLVVAKLCFSELCYHHQAWKVTYLYSQCFASKTGGTNIWDNSTLLVFTKCFCCADILI